MVFNVYIAPDNKFYKFLFIKVTEMEGILQEHHNAMPSREILVALAEKFRCAFFLLRVQYIV